MEGEMAHREEKLGRRTFFVLEAKTKPGLKARQERFLLRKMATPGALAKISNRDLERFTEGVMKRLERNFKGSLRKGVESLFEVYPAASAERYLRQSNMVRNDSVAMAADWLVVGRDLRSATEEVASQWRQKERMEKRDKEV
jgi:hypothetical protein